MQIKNCIASKPGLFNNKTIDLGDPITVIYGSNGTGKSVLARALLDCIWGSFSDEALLHDDIWESLFLQVLINNSSRNYLFTRNGEKYFRVKTVEDKSESLLYSREPFRSGNGSLPKINYGKPGPETNAALQYFRQFDIKSILSLSFLPSPVDVKHDTIINYEHLRKLLLDDRTNFYNLYYNVTASMDNESVRKRFDNQLVNRILKTEGDQKQIEKKIQIIDIQRSKMSKLENEKFHIQKELYSMREKLSGYRSKQKTLILIRKDLERKDAIQKKMNTIQDELDIEQEKEGLIKRKNRKINKLYPQFKNFSEEKKENLKKIQDTYREIRDVNEEYEKCRARNDSKKKRFRSFVISVIVSSAIIILMAFNNVFISFSESELFILIVGLLSISGLNMLTLLYYLFFNKKSRELIDISEIRSEVEDRLGRLLTENEISIDDYRLESLYEFLLQYFEEFGEYTELQLDIFMIKDTLKERAYVGDLENELHDLEQEHVDITQRIDGKLKIVGIGNDDSLSGEEIKTQVRICNDDIDRIQDVIEKKEKIGSTVNGEIQTFTNKDDERDILNDHKGRIDLTLQKLNGHKNSMDYILSILSDAIAVREDKQLKKLINSTRDKFHYLTKNQYISRIDTEQIIDLIKNRNVASEINSTILHLMLLSIKIALTEFLVDDMVMLPLIIDEPSQFMDATRLGRLQSLLDEIASVRQVIIFTHNKIFENFGNFIEL